MIDLDAINAKASMVFGCFSPANKELAREIVKLDVPALCAEVRALRALLGEVRPYVDGANMCGNALSSEYAAKVLARIDQAIGRV